MNFLFIALASVLIAVEVINTQTKDGEINKEKQVIVKEEVKPEAQQQQKLKQQQKPR